tara:strand:+ start:1202 stop:1396 length:195 start_codon:yes stop_codon:yes gene_type:complete
MKTWSAKIRIQGNYTEVECNANSYFDAKRIFAQMYNVNENEVSFIKEVKTDPNNINPIVFGEFD